MEHQAILNLLNEASNSKFVTRKWNIVYDNSKVNYDVENEMTYNTEVLKSNLCDYNNAYILVRGDITIAGRNIVTDVAFKNCAPFTKCITKIDGTTVDEAQDLDLVTPMYNLIKYGSNYPETTGSLCLYSKDQAFMFDADIQNTDDVIRKQLQMERMDFLKMQQLLCH